MLVKKINSEWFPSENKGLKVGETVDITNPKELILHGDVVAVDESGVEISSYDLYGIISKDERKDFEAYLQVKKATAYKEVLEKEQAELKAQAAKLDAPKETAKPVPAPADNKPILSASTPTKK